MPISFYSTREPYGEFSNFAKFGVKIGGEWWPTTEHYFQAQKFDAPDYRRKIRDADTPKRAADLGRSRSIPLRPDWESVKDDVMRACVLKKFETHPDLRALLLSTGDEELIENAPGDYYWGCGKDGLGKNMLGKILEEVRAALRAGN